jgi:hypothetical protein
MSEVLLGLFSFLGLQVSKTLRGKKKRIKKSRKCSVPYVAQNLVFRILSFLSALLS